MEITNNQQTLLEIENVMNPFYVFSGSIDPYKFIDIQIGLMEKMGAEEYFVTQLNVIHAAITQLIKEINPDKDKYIEPNTNIVGHA